MAMSKLALKLSRQLSALAALLAATDRLVVQGMESAGAVMFERRGR